MKASDLFVKCLETEGVETIFGIPGEENLDLMMSLLNSKIKFVLTRHEQAAAFMADSYGRMTGKPGVCLSTLGPGATNLITGVTSANLDRVPLVVITGQADTTRLHKESHQAIDLINLFRPCVKWGAPIEHPDTIPEVVRKAFRVAVQGKFGACHIDFPTNIAKLQTLVQPIPAVEIPRAIPDDRSIKEALKIIDQATFPIILAGNGVFRNHASDELRCFIKKTGIPVVNTFMGKGCLSYKNPLYLFTAGVSAKDYPDSALQEADCVIAVGFDMVEYHPHIWNKDHKKKIIHIDNTFAEIDDHYRPRVEVIGNIDISLDKMALSAKTVKKIDQSLYSHYRKSMLKTFKVANENDKRLLKPQHVLAEVQKIITKKTKIFSDVGAHKLWIARYLQTSHPNSVIISNGFCSMGFALPAALGAKMILPDHQILAICGDGGLMMNVHELETAVREKLPIVIMVWVDNEYGLISWKQKLSFGKSAYTRFSNPNWMTLAKSFGVKGYPIKKTSDLLPALKKAFQSKVPSLIAVPIDYSENIKLTYMFNEIPMNEIFKHLRGVSLFKNVPERYYYLIAELIKEQKVSAGTVIVNEGDQDETLYIVHRGTASVQKRGKEIATMGSGDCFGEMAAILSQPRTATVVAKTDLLLSYLEGASFRELIRSEPEIGLYFMRLFAERLARE